MSNRDPDVPAAILGLLVVTVLWVGGVFIAYRAGRVDERQTRDAIACAPNVDSVRVVPTRHPRPTDPVRSAP